MASAAGSSTTLPPLTAPATALHATLFASWYPNFRKVSPKATVLGVRAVQPELLDWLDQDGLVLPLGSDTPAGGAAVQEEDEDEEEDEEGETVKAPRFEALDSKIREVIKAYDGAVFPKFNWSAPQDSAWIVPGATLRCTTPADVYMLLKSSDFITSDVAQAKELYASSLSSSTAAVESGAEAAAGTDELEVPVASPSSALKLEAAPASLVLKKWFDMPPSHEFRCFVRAGRLICLSQRDRTFYEHLQLTTTQTTIKERLTKFFEENLKPRTPPPGAKPGREAGFPIVDFAFDAYLTRDLARVFLVDVGPYLPRTDALLWSWEEIEAQATELFASGQDKATPLPPLRLLTDRTQATQSAPTHSRNMVPRDMLERSDGKGIAQFAAEWEEALRNAAKEEETREKEVGMTGAQAAAFAARAREKQELMGEDEEEEVEQPKVEPEKEEAKSEPAAAKAVQFAEDTKQVASEEESEDADDDDAAPVGRASFFAALGGAGEQEESEEEEEEDISASAAGKKSKAKSKKKKKKRTSATAAEGEGAAVPAIAESTTADETPEGADVAAAAANASKASRKKKRSKASAGKASASGKAAKSNKDISSMSMDELTALLASQASAIDAREGVDSGDTTSLPAAPTGPLSSLRPLLAISAPGLDPTVELKRQFGAAAVRAYEAEAGNAGGDGTAAGAARARAQAWNSNAKMRNVLVHPPDTWPPIARTFTGMDMEMYEAPPSRGKLGAWVHSRAYREAQMNFMRAVQSYDPNQLTALLRRYPWHIDTLLQLSDVSRHQGDLGQASDWNTRALFAYERTALPAFTGGLTSASGPPQLDFQRVENRGFWLAAHRHVNFLGRRGTWRTALEWSKLLLGLDAVGDPHATLLWIDFLAIKSRQHAWLLDMLPKLDAAIQQQKLESQRGHMIIPARTPFDASDKEVVGEGWGYAGALDWCVGISYAKALALRALEKEEGDKTGTRSTAALRLAIARHPSLLPLLFDKIGLAFPPELRTHHLFAATHETRWTTKVDLLPLLLSHIYVARSESLWREAPTAKWLKETLEEAWPRLKEGAGKVQFAVADQTSRRAVYRHVLVSDIPDTLRQTLIGFFPPAVTGGQDSLDAWDPLPPLESTATRYDDAYFAPVQRELERQRARQSGAATGAALPPGWGMEDVIRGVRDMLRQHAGADRADQWVAAMENLDDEGREDMMLQVVQMMDGLGNQPGRANAMPGGFAQPAPPPMEEQEEDYESDTTDEPEQARPGAIGALANAMRGWWGGNEGQAPADADADADEVEQID